MREPEKPFVSIGTEANDPLHDLLIIEPSDLFEARNRLDEARQILFKASALYLIDPSNENTDGLMLAAKESLEAVKDFHILVIGDEFSNNRDKANIITFMLFYEDEARVKQLNSLFENDQDKGPFVLATGSKEELTKDIKDWLDIIYEKSEKGEDYITTANALILRLESIYGRSLAIDLDCLGNFGYKKKTDETVKTLDLFK